MPTTRREVLLSTGALAGTSLLTGREALSQQSDPLEEEGAAALNVWDFKKIAQQRLSQASWDFITGAAGDEITMRWNREAYDRIRLEPNVLVDVSGVDTRTRLFGQEIPFPILVSPAEATVEVTPTGSWPRLGEPARPRPSWPSVPSPPSPSRSWPRWPPRASGFNST